MRVAEQVLVNNFVITDDDIERIAAPFETGNLEGADEEMRRAIDRKTALNRTPEEIERMRPEITTAESPSIPASALPYSSTPYRDSRALRFANRESRMNGVENPTYPRPVDSMIWRVISMLRVAVSDEEGTPMRRAISVVDDACASCAIASRYSMAVLDRPAMAVSSTARSNSLLAAAMPFWTSSMAIRSS